MYKYIDDLKAGKVSGMKGKTNISGHIRRYLFIKYDSSCQKCGWSEVNIKTKRVPLEVHHIDGDHYNNGLSNLELLCPNCHSITGTFKSLNKNGRTR